MVAIKLIGVFLCLLGTTVIATTRSSRLSSPAFCNLQQLTTKQPSQFLQFEGGSSETYLNLNDEEFQCFGLNPERMTIQTESLLLPNFAPFPHLFFIEEGEGIFGVQLPGCAETFDTGVQQQQPRKMAERPQEQQEFGDISKDSHQKVFRFRQGDFIAIPAGAVHWIYNDGNQDVLAIVVDDINNPSNQLDITPRISFLAGGVSSQHLQGQQEQQGFFRPEQEDFHFKSIYAGFDRELLVESFNESPEVVRALQEPSNRGLIVKVQQPMRFVTPDVQQFSRGGLPANGLEEGRFCSSKLVFNLDSQREADIFSQQAGKLNLVNEHKLPILSHMDVSAEKGYLQPNALFSPHWTVNSHTLVYVLNGEAQVQVVSNNGQAVLDEQVNKGDVFFVPQFFATTARAGQNGFEWVAFKTNKSPLKSPVAGYTSVFRAMPLEVITNAYMVSPSQAQGLKMNRQTESLLFSPISQRS
ncbi:11S globulin seed storage protein 2-like [Bidens hawaiensis]|uniref:11S globulin seed storage protein 2-like n=1 Tax=Bidens hawaiensis TaxID=980011 RepID=UPI00404A6056